MAKDVRVRIPFDENWFWMEVRRGMLVVLNAIEVRQGIYPRTSQLRNMYKSGRIKEGTCDR